MSDRDQSRSEGKVELAVELGGFFERCPQIFVMPEDSEPYAFAFYQIEKLACAGMCPGRIQINTIIRQARFGGEVDFHSNGVDGEQDRPGVWEADEDCLVAGNVATGFNELNAGHKFGIAIDEPVAEAGMIPMLAGQRETWGLTGAGELIVGPLDNEFGPGKASWFPQWSGSKWVQTSRVISCGVRPRVASCSTTEKMCMLWPPFGVKEPSKGTPVSTRMFLPSLV